MTTDHAFYHSSSLVLRSCVIVDNLVGGFVIVIIFVVVLVIVVLIFVFIAVQLQAIVILEKRQRLDLDSEALGFESFLDALVTQEPR